MKNALKMNSEAEKENGFLRKQVTALQQQISSLQEQIKWFQKQVFGKKSERIVNGLDSCTLLLPGFESLENSKEEQIPQDVAPHKRKKPVRHGKDSITIPDDLPVEQVVLDIPEKDKVCKITGKRLVKIGEEITRKLAHKPGSFFVKEYIRPKYALSSKEEDGVKTADLPESFIPKCRADESVLAEIITEKFANHMPLYRIAESFSREGIGISRQLLSQWLIRAGNILEPLYQVMTKHILESGNVFADETPVNILNKGKCSQGYICVLVGGKGKDPPYRVYHFAESRKANDVLHLIKDYKKVLHSDKYGAYERLANQKQITWCPCWSHVRRKFVEAECGDSAFRKYILRKIRYLFLLERIAWSRSSNERLRIRKVYEEPIIDELIQSVRARLVEGKLLPKSNFTKALNYFYGLQTHLKNYLSDPYARMDNNVAERALRPLAVGRKNWLFFGSANGGRAAVVLLSLVQTCRGLGINPREYLEDIFKRFMSHPYNKLEELLPDQWRKRPL